MSFFPRSYYSPDTSFTPLFRLLDDFDNYSREVQGSNTEGGRRGRRHGAAVPTFNPRFDVRETEAAYELHGELPGIEKDNVQIEFTEPQTIVVRGRVERSYSSGTPPAGLVEDTQMSGAITEKGEGEHHQDAHAASHKATVEDENAEGRNNNTSTEMTKKGDQQAAQHQQEKPTEKFWVSERSIGEFSRTFSFPTRVDQDAVSANLNNGVLSITVPKAKKHESRRIAVN